MGHKYAVVDPRNSMWLLSENTNLTLTETSQQEGHSWSVSHFQESCARPIFKHNAMAGFLFPKSAHALKLIVAIEDSFKQAKDSRHAKMVNNQKLYSLYNSGQ